jgi:HEPN domain-containing protein
MKDNRDLAQGWLEKARSDIYAAESVLASTGPYDTACFHAQQAIEKALKALLACFQQPIPRTHDLDELQRLCLASRSSPELEALDLTEITDYAVQLRYDIEFWPEKETAETALALANQVIKLVRTVLDE